MVATSGAQLLPNDAITNLREKLLPLTTILTPNIPEAKLILDNAGIEYPEIRSFLDLADIASLLHGLGPEHVLLKGGHLPFGQEMNIPQHAQSRRFIVDILYSSDMEATSFTTDYSPSKNTHGTGCSLACTSPPPTPSLTRSSRTFPSFFSLPLLPA